MPTLLNKLNITVPVIIAFVGRLGIAECISLELHKIATPTSRDHLAPRSSPPRPGGGKRAT